MRSTTRKPVRNMYDACRNCADNISGYGKCKKQYDNFYYRKGKNNHCRLCQEGTGKRA